MAWDRITMACSAEKGKGTPVSSIQIVHNSNFNQTRPSQFIQSANQVIPPLTRRRPAGMASILHGNCNIQLYIHIALLSDANQRHMVLHKRQLERERKKIGERHRTHPISFPGLTKSTEMGRPSSIKNSTRSPRASSSLPTAAAPSLKWESQLECEKSADRFPTLCLTKPLASSSWPKAIINVRRGR